jgi:hypothetical protein
MSLAKSAVLADSLGDAETIDVRKVGTLNQLTGAVSALGIGTGLAPDGARAQTFCELQDIGQTRPNGRTTPRR